MLFFLWFGLVLAFWHRWKESNVIFFIHGIIIAILNFRNPNKVLILSFKSKSYARKTLKKFFLLEKVLKYALFEKKVYSVKQKKYMVSRKCVTSFLNVRNVDAVTDGFFDAAKWIISCNLHFFVTIDANRIIQLYHCN